MFDKVSIAGFGLIGSSIAHNCLNKNLAKQVVCYDLSEDVCSRVMELKLAHQASTDPSVIKGSDLLIICVPVGAIALALSSLKPYIDHGMIVTDVGSVKVAAMKAAKEHLPNPSRFVAGHPMAGTEFSGPDAGFESLFEGKLWLLTPDDETDIRALEDVQSFCTSMGANVSILESGRHDHTVAMTSHLPQLISYGIMQAADRLATDLGHDVLSYSANGFHGFARIAISDPIMWRDIYLNNKDHALDVMDRFSEILDQMRNMIEKEEGAAMQEFFTRSRECRLQHLERKKASGQ